MSNTPSVGRIVHYTNLGDKDGKYPPQIVAAIITKVEPKTTETYEEGDFKVSLKAFYPQGVVDMADVPFTDAEAGTDAARGKWGWPARV